MADIGAELSVGEMSLKALVELTSATRDMHDTLKGLLALEQRYQMKGPVDVQLRAAANSDASGDDLFLDLGGPSYGQLWEIRRLVVGGATYDSVVLGSGQVVVSSAIPNIATVNTWDPAILDIVDQTATLPKVTFYSAAQIVLRHPQHLWIFFDGTLTASVTYAASGLAIMTPDAGGGVVFTA